MGCSLCTNREVDVLWIVNFIFVLGEIFIYLGVEVAPNYWLATSDYVHTKSLHFQEWHDTEKHKFRLYMWKDI